MRKTILSFVAFIFVASSFATKVTVTTTNDDGIGSLRSALDSISSGDTIDFNVTGVIKLRSVLELTKSVTIMGPGADLLAIDGDHKHKIFKDSVLTLDTLVISGLELKNANGYSDGAAIAVHLTELRVFDCNIHSNSLDYSYGSGIFISGFGSSLEVNNCAFYNNFSLGFGNGIFATDTATVTVSNSTFYNNYGSVGGLSIFVYGSDLTLTNVTIAGHTGASAIMLRNFEESSDSAKHKKASLTVENCIFDNEEGNLSFFDSLVTVISMGYNISNDSSMMEYLTAYRDRNNVSAILDTNGIQNNGGATLTVALQCGSPALDSGKLVFPTDQNYKARIGSGPDIGAYEGNTYASDSILSLTRCDDFFWPQNSMTYTQSGVYVDTIPNFVGCDSVVTLVLTVNSSKRDTLKVDACDNFTWHGQVYESSGFYIDSYTTTLFCDSILYLDLAIYTTNDSISRVLDTLFSNDTNSTYQWIDCLNGDVALEGDTNRWFSPIYSGQYAVILTNGACVDTTSRYSMTKIGLFEQQLKYEDFKVFPNPTKQYLNIELSQKIIGKDIYVYDLTGTLILQQKINNIIERIDISLLSLGVYLIQYEGRVQRLIIGR